VQISRRFVLLLTPAVDIWVLIFFIWPQICLDTRRIWLGTYPGYSKVKSRSFMCSVEPKRLVNSLPISVTSVHFLTLLVKWNDYPSAHALLVFIAYTVWDLRLMIAQTTPKFCNANIFVLWCKHMKPQV